jgi:hypothetical protein
MNIYVHTAFIKCTIINNIIMFVLWIVYNNSIPTSFPPPISSIHKQLPLELFERVKVTTSHSSNSTYFYLWHSMMCCIGGSKVLLLWQITRSLIRASNRSWLVECRILNNNHNFNTKKKNAGNTSIKPYTKPNSLH